MTPTAYRPGRAVAGTDSPCGHSAVAGPADPRGHARRLARTTPATLAHHGRPAAGPPVGAHESWSADTELGPADERIPIITSTRQEGE